MKKRRYWTLIKRTPGAKPDFNKKRTKKKRNACQPPLTSSFLASLSNMMNFNCVLITIKFVSFTLLFWWYRGHFQNRSHPSWLEAPAISPPPYSLNNKKNCFHLFGSMLPAWSRFDWQRIGLSRGNLNANPVRKSIDWFDRSLAYLSKGDFEKRDDMKGFVFRLAMISSNIL